MTALELATKCYVEMYPKKVSVIADICGNPNLLNFVREINKLPEEDRLLIREWMTDQVIYDFLSIPITEEEAKKVANQIDEEAS